MRAHEFIPGFRSLINEDQREDAIKSALITLLTSSQVSGVDKLTMSQIQKSLSDQGYHNIRPNWVVNQVQDLVSNGDEDGDKLLKSADETGVEFNSSHDSESEETDASAPLPNDKSQDAAVVDSMASSALKKRTP